MGTPTEPVRTFATEKQWIDCTVVNYLYTIQISTLTIKPTYKKLRFTMAIS
jgi:hypothetical protein